MKLQEACEKLNKLAGVKFKDLFSAEGMKERYGRRTTIMPAYIGKGMNKEKIVNYGNSKVYDI